MSAAASATGDGQQLNPDDFIDDVAVIILAGGTGERLGGSRPKAFVGLAGEVLLAHSLRAFEDHDAVDSIVLVVPEDWVAPTEVLVDDLGCDRVASIEIAGSSRAASVVAGLEAVVDRRGTAVLVHDAARPVVPAELIDRVLAPLSEGADAVVPVLEVTDTIKQVDPSTGKIVATPARADLRRAQTPQACRSSSLHAALRGLDDAALALITDCSMAIERNGGSCVVVDGDVRSHKITTAADLAEIEAILAPPAPPAEADVAVDASGQVLGDDDPEDLEPLDEEDLAGAETP